MDKLLKELERQELDITSALKARLTDFGRLKLTQQLCEVLAKKTIILQQQLENIKNHGNRNIN